jgi:glycosyltransferase involved in cell wall biosynthesis
MDDWVREGDVEYLGKTDNVAEYIRNASCVVLPYYREGIFRVCVESAAMCRFVVVANVSGCREVVQHGVTGFLCKSKDSIELPT